MCSSSELTSEETSRLERVTEEEEEWYPGWVGCEIGKGGFLVVGVEDER